MKAIKTMFALSIITLSGCAALDQIAQDMQSVIPQQEQITSTLPAICQAAKDNEVKANSLYKNKLLIGTGKIDLIMESYKIGTPYTVTIKTGNVSVFAGVKNERTVMNLKVDQNTSFSGTVDSVKNDFNGCSIWLTDSSF